MEDNRNWRGWAALVLAGAALVIALVGRVSPPSVAFTAPDVPVPSEVGPQLPSIPPGQMAQPNDHSGWLDPQFGSRQQGQPGFGPGLRGIPRAPEVPLPEHRMPRGFDRGPSHHHFPFFAPFFWLFGLVRLAGVALLVWLLIKFFQGRRDRPSGA